MSNRSLKALFLFIYEPSYFVWYLPQRIIDNNESSPKTKNEVVVDAKCGSITSIHHNIRDTKLQNQPIGFKMLAKHSTTNSIHCQLHHEYSNGINHERFIIIFYFDSQVLCLKIKH